MPADAPLDEPADQPSPAQLAALRARYPHWTIWYGRATRRWWALAPRECAADTPGTPAIDRFIEATTVKELTHSIETLLSRTASPPRGSPPPSDPPNGPVPRAAAPNQRRRGRRPFDPWTRDARMPGPRPPTTDRVPSIVGGAAWPAGGWRETVPAHPIPTAAWPGSPPR